MDIFYGSSSNLARDRILHFHRLAGIDEFSLEEPSVNMAILKNPVSGECRALYNEGREILFDGYLTGVRPEEQDTVIKRIASDLVHGKTDNIFYNGIFNICIRDTVTGNIWLGSDPSALLPLYYYHSEGSFSFCSHGYLMASLLNTGPDFKGIFQKTYYGYTIGSRTCFRGIERVNPGETVKYSAADNSLSVLMNKVYYTEAYSKNDLSEKIINALNDSFTKTRKIYSDVGLMLSEGFDSRFLGGLAMNAGFNIRTFTHGTPGSGGSKITDRVAEAINSDHCFYDMQDGFPSTHENVRRQLLLSDNLNVPYWVNASEYLRSKLPDSPVMIGTALDSTLGGHAFYRSSRNILSAVFQRYSEILMQDCRALTPKYIERLSEELLNEVNPVDLVSYKKSLEMIYTRDVVKSILDGAEGTREILDCELSRLKETGSLLSSQRLQRFFLEHRARKFSFGQELTIRINNKIFIPSYEDNFMSLASCINPYLKLHHNLYLKIFRGTNKDLLKIPIGAFGMPAVNSRLILETSRFIHKKRERTNYVRFMNSSGKVPPSVFRSVLITDYCRRDKEKLQEFRDMMSASGDLLNQAGINKYLDSIMDFKKRPFNYERIYSALEISEAIRPVF